MDVAVKADVPMLRVAQLTVRFAGVTALDDVSFDVEPGRVCGLIGPNGAGKTTLFDCVSRLTRPQGGRIELDGRDLLALESHQVAALGVARTFQHLGLLGSLTVRENVMLGGHHACRAGFVTAALRLPLAGHQSAARGRAALRHAQAHRTGQGAWGRAPGAAARRARKRPVARGGRRARRRDRRPPRRRRRPDGAAGRAPHGPGHAHVRQGGGAGLRPQDRRGRARGGPRGPGGGAGVPGGAGMTALLEVEGLRAGYGPVRALHGVDLAVQEGGVVAILGPNGAGKTTLLRALTGMVHTSGRISFDGRSLAGLSTSTIARLGVAHVPEGRGTFPALTVEENLRLGAYTRRDAAGVRADIARWYELFPQLAERAGQAAGNLSGGEQQMLAIARALLLRPRLLLLDEPSLGLAPMVTRELFGVLGLVKREQGTTMLLVEQNANMALELADHAYVLEAGRTVLAGPAGQVRSDESVRRAYLGY